MLGAGPAGGEGGSCCCDEGAITGDRKRDQLAFGLLILAQAAHSVEEYFGRLWESFPPAHFVSGLVSTDRELGFLIVNAALVTFGVWCYLFPVLRRWRSARAIALGWALVECINGLGHPLWSLRQGSYTPGLGTSPILLALSLLLLARSLRDPNLPLSRT